MVEVARLVASRHAVPDERLRNEATHIFRKWKLLHHFSSYETRLVTCHSLGNKLERVGVVDGRWEGGADKIARFGDAQTCDTGKTALFSRRNIFIMT